MVVYPALHCQSRKLVADLRVLWTVRILIGLSGVLVLSFAALANATGPGLSPNRLASAVKNAPFLCTRNSYATRRAARYIAKCRSGDLGLPAPSHVLEAQSLPRGQLLWRLLTVVLPALLSPNRSLVAR